MWTKFTSFLTRPLFFLGRNFFYIFSLVTTSGGGGGVLGRWKVWTKSTSFLTRPLFFLGRKFSYSFTCHHLRWRWWCAGEMEGVDQIHLISY